jgi:hypothetical protein
VLTILLILAARPTTAERTIRAEALDSPKSSFTLIEKRIQDYQRNIRKMVTDAVFMPSNVSESPQGNDESSLGVLDEWHISSSRLLPIVTHVGRFTKVLVLDVGSLTRDAVEPAEAIAGNLACVYHRFAALIYINHVLYHQPVTLL